MARRALLDQFQLPNVGFIGCTVTLYTADATGAATATKATLYDDLTGTGTLSNPQSFNSEGALSQPTYIDVAVVSVVAGAHVASQTLGVVSPPGGYRGDWATATLYLPGDWVTDGAAGGNTAEIYAVINLHQSGVWATDAANANKLKKVSNFSALSIAPDATEAVKGKAEIATQAETNAGTDDLRFITPLKSKTLLQAVPYDTGLVSTTAGAAEGPTEELYRNITGAAANLGGVHAWAMKSSTSVKRVVAKTLSRLVTATNAAEDAALDFYTIVAGTLARRFSLGAGLYANGLTDKGAGTVNTTGLYVNGVSAAKIAQVQIVQGTTYQNCTTALPDDDTKPQNTEGDAVTSLSIAFTPLNAASTLLIEADVPVFNSTTTNGAVVIVNNAVADSLSAKPFGSNTGTFPKNCTVVHSESAASLTARTYSVRCGASSGSVYVNGNASARVYGGVLKATLKITEILP